MDQNNQENFEFVDVASVDEIPNLERLFVSIDGKEIVVININQEFYAIADICSHDDGPLGEGEIEGNKISCPRHGALFDIRNGKALTLPAVVDIPSYPIQIVNGRIEIGLPLSI